MGQRYAFSLQNKRMLFHTFLSGASVLSGWPSTYLSIRARLGGSGVVRQETGEGVGLANTRIHTHIGRTGPACWPAKNPHQTGLGIIPLDCLCVGVCNCKEVNLLCVWFTSLCVSWFFISVRTSLSFRPSESGSFMNLSHFGPFPRLPVLRFRA